MSSFRVAVVGALGAVGQEMAKTLEQRAFPVSEFIPMDVESMAGKKVSFKGREAVVRAARKGAFRDVDIALFSAGAEASLELAPIAAAEGAIVIDNSSAWRMDPGVPLVVPEVNPQALDGHKGIIANPNCSTIQMLVAAKPIHDKYRIKRIVVSTYQAVSGTGAPAIAELTSQAAAFVKGERIESSVYPRQILFNALPHIDVFLEDGYTKEEMKMVHETHKILDPAIAVCPTAVRVAVYRGHSESINIQTEKPFELAEIRRLLERAPGVKVMDDPAKLVYPTALDADGQDAVFVGRLRVDPTLPNGLNMWVVSDNLRKGAALNAVQIAETLVARGYRGRS
ncbi:MAG TPA: aspartate-semialdehyde dehydrogenase [Spirochaetales bacterium]|nr:aspartate-semialdehyde dehydrogenase [Spirochaetales bacterium]HRZ66441.1 aspartate-semialdehyde dehydrogenase [Spirochaetia bacterium]